MDFNLVKQLFIQDNYFQSCARFNALNTVQYIAEQYQHDKLIHTFRVTPEFISEAVIQKAEYVTMT